MHPVLPATGLRKISDEGMTVGGYNIAVGSSPMVNTAAIHHNPRFWVKDYDADKHCNVDMEAIHIEFWLDDEGAFARKLHSDHFFTFHTGKRDCVGQALVMKELVIVLAMMFMKYRMKWAEDDQPARIEAQKDGAFDEPKNTTIRMEARKLEAAPNALEPVAVPMDVEDLPVEPQPEDELQALH